MYCKYICVHSKIRIFALEQRRGIVEPIRPVNGYHMKMISSTCSKCMSLSHLQKKAFSWLWNVIILAHICVCVIPRVQWSHIQTYIQRVHFLEKIQISIGLNVSYHLMSQELNFLVLSQYFTQRKVIFICMCF